MIAADPSQVKYYLFLAQLYSSNNMTDKALKVLQTAEKIKPNNGLTIWLLQIFTVITKYRGQL